MLTYLCVFADILQVTRLQSDSSSQTWAICNTIGDVSREQEAARWGDIETRIAYRFPTSVDGTDCAWLQDFWRSKWGGLHHRGAEFVNQIGNPPL